MAILWHHGVRTGKLSPSEFVAVTSTNAARIFNIYGKKGVLAAGADADVVIWDPSKTRTISAQTHHQKIDFNIYEGMEVTGNPAKTFVRGQLAWDGTSLHTKEGFGRYVHKPCHARFFEQQRTRNAASQPTPVERVLPTRG
jgi:dihydropyrimidinase